MEVNHQSAKSTLDHFIDNGLSSYANQRNFDFGPSKRDNVSSLSRFIARRVIHEREIILSCLKKFEYKKIEKFVQEVFWRTYWKGWLEGRPKVWSDYLESLNHYNTSIESKNFFKDYRRAINAETGISCFDHWVHELKDFGYLHNHTRMWFASIWIFTLNLPWELGANFFYRNLLDADAASNTLSWRWVAGLHTSGKFYLAKQNNIEKYSTFKFSKADTLTSFVKEPEHKYYDFQETSFNQSDLNQFNYMLLNPNYLIYEKNYLKKIQNIEIIHYDYYSHESDSDKKKAFIRSACNEYIKKLKKLKIKVKIANDKREFKDISNKLKIVCPYPSVGYEKNTIDDLAIANNFDLHYFYDSFDLKCWPYAKSGFFKFKNNIEDIIENLNNLENNG